MKLSYHVFFKKKRENTKKEPLYFSFFHSDLKKILQFFQIKNPSFPNLRKSNKPFFQQNEVSSQQNILDFVFFA